MANRHHLRLFGSVELLEPDGYPVHFRSRKQLALLVYLALESRDRLIERSRLVDLFWGEVEYAKGSHSLAQALTAIRAVLGPHALNRFQDKVQLLASLTTDLDCLVPRAFRPEVLGSPLPELEDCGGRSFALWIETVRGRCLVDIRRRLAADLAEARRGGLVQDAREAATLLHAVDPTNDLAALVVAEHSAADGDVDGAVGLLRRHVTLAREEGRSPSGELAGFLQRLERGLFTMLGDPATDATASLVQARPEVFVDRARELRGLESQWARARDCCLVTALVTGVHGVGKSTLVRRFATGIAARGWPVYMIGCQEIGASIPFAAVSDLILQLARDPAVSGTDPRWLAEASRVTPALRSVYTGIPESQPSPAEAVRLRVAEALAGILEAVRDGGPLLLAIDDVHFMDSASREVIHISVRRLERTAMLILGTADAGDAGRIHRETSNLLAWQEEVVLENLDAAGITRLVRALASRFPSVGGDICDKIGELSQGNPYLAEMLLSDWHNHGANSLVAAELDPLRIASDWRPSGAMRRAFKRQYQGLSNNSEHMLHLLAVAGRAVPAREVRELLDLERSQMDRAVLELVDRSTVRVWGDALEFRNEPHRAFVYFQMPEEARTYYHARLAASLAASGRGYDFQQHLEASHHFVKAGMVNDAVEAVCIGADLAVTRGAPKEAERALQLVLSSSTRTVLHLYVHLARALAAEGRFKEALRSVESAARGKPTGYEAVVAAAARVEALHRGRLGDDSTIREALRYALTMTQGSGNAILSMRVLQIAVEIASETGSKGALASLRSKMGRIRDGASDPEVASLAQLTQGYCLLVEGAVRKAALQFIRAQRALKELSLESEARQALNGLGIAYYFLGSFQDSIASFEQAIECATSIGDSAAAATSWSNLGAVYEDLGEFSLAEESYQNAFENESVASNPRRAVEVQLNLASLMMLKGDLTQAARCLEVARSRVADAGLWWLFTDLCLCEADLHLFQSSPEQAWQLIMQGQANTKSRMYLLSDMTRMERLTRHHIWATQGVRAMQDSTSSNDLARRCVKLSGRLEVLAFEQWILKRECVLEKQHQNALEDLTTLQLKGVITRIAKIQETYARS